jgi:MYXO-CTERM domain-containing protein
MSHGCGDGCVTTDEAYFTGWPSMMIDASAVQNRAMEWLSFRFDLSGELYFETTYDLPTAWDDQCDFSGNGDGTLFYPGTPDRIGGSEHIPIESIRLKLVREGMEDYELLHLLCQLGDCAYAHQVADALFPAPYQVTSVSPSQLLAARAGLADRIEELLGQTPDGEDGSADAADGGQDADVETDAGPDAVPDSGSDSGGDAAGDTDATLGGGCGCGADGPGPGGLLLALGLLAALYRRRSGGGVQ